MDARPAAFSWWGAPEFYSCSGEWPVAEAEAQGGDGELVAPASVSLVIFRTEDPGGVSRG